MEPNKENRSKNVRNNNSQASRKYNGKLNIELPHQSCSMRSEDKLKGLKDLCFSVKELKMITSIFDKFLLGKAWISQFEQLLFGNNLLGESFIINSKKITFKEKFKAFAHNSKFLILFISFHQKIFEISENLNSVLNFTTSENQSYVKSLLKKSKIFKTDKDSLNRKGISKRENKYSNEPLSKKVPDLMVINEEGLNHLEKTDIKKINEGSNTLNPKKSILKKTRSSKYSDHSNEKYSKHKIDEEIIHTLSNNSKRLTFSKKAQVEVEFPFNVDQENGVHKLKLIEIDVEEVDSPSLNERKLVKRTPTPFKSENLSGSQETQSLNSDTHEACFNTERRAKSLTNNSKLSQEVEFIKVINDTSGIKLFKNSSIGNDSAIKRINSHIKEPKDLLRISPSIAELKELNLKKEGCILSQDMVQNENANHDSKRIDSEEKLN